MQADVSYAVSITNGAPLPKTVPAVETIPNESVNGADVPLIVKSTTVPARAALAKMSVIPQSLSMEVKYATGSPWLSIEFLRECS